MIVQLVIRLQVLPVLDRVVDLVQYVLHAVFLVYIQREESTKPRLNNQLGYLVRQMLKSMIELARIFSQLHLVELVDFRQLLQLGLVLHKVALRKHCEGGQLQGHGGRERHEQATHVLRMVAKKVNVEEVDRADGDPQGGEHSCELLHHVNMRVELDLPRAVEEYIVVLRKVVELLLQPVDVEQKVLHAVDKSSVRAELKLLHHVLQLNQVADVHGALVRQVLSRWV